MIAITDTAIGRLGVPSLLVALCLFLGPLMASDRDPAPLPEIPAGSATAVFAGGCFWCLQPAFDGEPGVSATRVGYIGGHRPQPTYEDICTGTSGHYEAILVVFDPSHVSYDRLLTLFWQQIDPTQADGQFADIGPQYRTAIFPNGPDQQRQAEASRTALAASGRFDRPIATTILPPATFYPAELYHQAYYQKQRRHYEAYKEGSGRAPFLRRTWPTDKPSQ
jgi:peptide methionine sulfoxide reductase msrA/msrB